MVPAEIVLPITKPETEWVRGRALQKMSPTRDHSRVQGAFLIAIEQWMKASGHAGEVGPEWRFRLAPPGEARRPLVPDVSYVAADVLRGRSHAEIHAPEFPPTVAVEVLSPGDDRRDVAAKVAAYLGSGVRLVLVLDPRRRTAIAYDVEATRHFHSSETFEHPALPGFTLELTSFFAGALDLIR